MAGDEEAIEQPLLIIQMKENQIKGSFGTGLIHFYEMYYVYGK